jgi:hypothetical protein
MAKKVNQTLKAKLAKNLEKGGAWLLDISITNESSDQYVLSTCSAWSNASAAKRYLKQVVLDNTPRKSIKMSVVMTDANDKPARIEGELTYKVDA